MQLLKDRLSDAMKLHGYSERTRETYVVSVQNSILLTFGNLIFCLTKSIYLVECWRLFIETVEGDGSDSFL